MTPLEIEILLHYHVRADDYRGGDFSAPAVRQTIAGFLDQLHLIETIPDGDKAQDNRTYRLTPRGQTYVQGLMELPLPDMVWIIPRTAVPTPDRDDRPGAVNYVLDGRPKAWW